MRKGVLIVTVLISISCALSISADMVISYTSGECSVDVHGTGNWVNAALHMELYEDSIVKTGSDGKIELHIEGEHVAVGSDTAVAVRSILENMQARDTMTWFGTLSDWFTHMFGSRDQEMVSLGIRGDLEDEDEITWMGDNSDEETESDMELGKEYYGLGKYGEATTIFKGLMRTDQSSALRGELAYYLGASLFNSVQYEEAIPYLREAIKDREAYFREPALMYYSFACFFTGQYDRAIDGFITYMEEFEGGELIPYAILMLGKSYKAVGDGERALVYFREIEQNYSETEVYLDAISELRGL